MHTATDQLIQVHVLVILISNKTITKFGMITESPQYTGYHFSLNIRLCGEEFFGGHLLYRGLTRYNHPL